MYFYTLTFLISQKRTQNRLELLTDLSFTSPTGSHVEWCKQLIAATISSQISGPVTSEPMARDYKVGTPLSHLQKPIQSRLKVCSDAQPIQDLVLMWTRTKERLNPIYFCLCFPLFSYYLKGGAIELLIIIVLLEKKQCTCQDR